MSDREKGRSQFGLAPGCVELVFELERVVANVRLPLAQQALASAVWRAVNRTAGLRAGAEFCLDKVTLSHGGRAVRPELVLFPPEGTPSIDLTSSTERVTEEQQLELEARFRFERAKSHPKESGLDWDRRVLARCLQMEREAKGMKQGALARALAAYDRLQTARERVKSYETEVEYELGRLGAEERAAYDEHVSGKRDVIAELCGGALQRRG
jgi:hypothetical protein